MNAFSLYADAFSKVIQGGLGNLLQHAEYFAYVMTALGLCVLASSVMFHNHSFMGSAFKFTIMSAFYLMIVRNTQMIGEGIMESAIAFGLEGGGSSANPQAFLESPDAIFLMGFARAQEMFDMAGQVCHASTWGCLGNMDTWIPVYAGAWIVLLVFALVAFLVLATAILFKLSLMAGMLLLPLAMFPPTAQFGFMPVRAVIHFAVQLMVLTLVVSVGNLVLGVLQLGVDPGVSAVTPLLVGVLAFAGTVMGASRLAYSLVGGAMLSAGALFGAPAGIAAVATRSGAGHLDGPVTTLSAAGGGKAYTALRAAAARNVENMAEMTTRPKLRPGARGQQTL